MKRALIILLAAALAALPGGPGPARALAQVVARTGGAVGAPGSAAAGGGALSGAGHLAGSPVFGSLIPAIRLDTTLRSVASPQAFAAPNLNAVSLPKSAVYPFVVPVPDAAKPVPTKAVSQLREQATRMVGRVAGVIGKKDDKGKAGTGFSRSFAHWRGFFDGAVAREKSEVGAAAVRGRSPLAGLPAANAIGEAPAARRVPWAAGDKRVAVRQDAASMALALGAADIGERGTYEFLTKPVWRIDELAPPALPGRRELSAYRVKKSISRRRAAYLAAHYGLLAAGLAASAFAFGAVPFIAASGILLADLYWQEKVYANSHDDGMYAFDSTLSTSERKNYRAYIETSLKKLVSRLGIDPADSPSVSINNRRGRLGAAVSGRGLASASTLTAGEGFAEIPAEETTAVLAHELGHGVAGDFGMLRLLRNRLGLRLGLEFVKKAAAYGFLIHVASVLLAPALLAPALIAGLAAFSVMIKTRPAAARALLAVREKLRPLYGEKLWSPGALAASAAALVLALQFFLGAWALPVAPETFAAGALWALGGLALTAGGLLSGIAVTRQEELRADDFAGWLTRPDWLISFFRRHQSPGARASGWRGLLSTHPAWEARIRELREER
ncbi:MAG: hypothetical protein ABIJ96_14080 [Elusimicrobiota bacterium]